MPRGGRGGTGMESPRWKRGRGRGRCALCKVRGFGVVREHRGGRDEASQWSGGRGGRGVGRCAPGKVRGEWGAGGAGGTGGWSVPLAPPVTGSGQRRARSVESGRPGGDTGGSRGKGPGGVRDPRHGQSRWHRGEPRRRLPRQHRGAPGASGGAGRRSEGSRRHRDSRAPCTVRGVGELRWHRGEPGLSNPGVPRAAPRGEPGSSGTAFFGAAPNRTGPGHGCSLRPKPPPAAGGGVAKPHPRCCLHRATGKAAP